MKLTTWIPELAKTTGLPAQLVHLKAQQFAKVAGFAWGMEMPAEQVEALSEEVARFYNGGKDV